MVVDDFSISLMALIGIRFLASAVFLDMLFRQRKPRYLVLTLAWLVYFMGPLWTLIKYNQSGMTDTPLFAFTAAMATVLLMGGVFLTFRTVKTIHLLTGIMSIFIILGLIALIFPAASSIFGIFTQLIFILVTLGVMFFRRKWFIKFGGNSYNWLLPIVVFSMIHALGFSFVYPEAPLSIRFFFTFLINTSLLIFFLHFEYNQTLRQLIESEGRTQFLFDTAPVALFDAHAPGVTASFTQLRSQGIQDVRQYMKDHPEFLEGLFQKLEVLNANHEAMKLLAAHSKRELIEGFTSRFTAESYQAFAEIIACLHDGHGQATMETSLIDLAGNKRDVIVDVHFATPDISPYTGVISMVDITDRKKAEAELYQYSTQLEEMVDVRTQALQSAQELLIRREKLATLGQISGSVGHELRNPLGVISNAIYYLRMVQPDADDMIIENLNIIASETKKAEKIINDLLAYGRIKPVVKGQVDVMRLVNRTLANYPAPDKVRIIINIPDDLPLMLVDPQHIEQILTNLIVNAYQAMPDGGDLTLTARTQDNDLLLTVQDTGTGISPEHLMNIFEPLYTTKLNGVGLGLSLCDNLIKANGGVIEVESVEKEGSTFTIRLPLNKQESLPLPPAATLS